MKNFLKTCWANLLGKEIVLRLTCKCNTEACLKSVEYLYDSFAEAEEVKEAWLKHAVEGETAEVFMR